MKKSIVLSIVAAIVTAFSFTSCNTEGSSFSWPTDTEARTILQTIGGTNSGKMVYYSVNKNNAKDVADTLSYISWNINTVDSVLTVNEFPVSIFAEYISGNDALKAAVLAAEPADIKAKVIPYSVSNYTFLINPVSVTKTLTYGGASHKVQFVFYTNTYSSFGQKVTFTDTTTKKTSTILCMKMILGAIYIDDAKTSYLSYSINGYNVTPEFYFEGTK